MPCQFSKDGSRRGEIECEITEFQRRSVSALDEVGHKACAAVLGGFIVRRIAVSAGELNVLQQLHAFSGLGLQKGGTLMS